MWTRHADVDSFLARCLPFFGRDELACGLVHSIAHAVASGRYAERNVLLAACEREGGVVGAAVRTPPWGMLVTGMDEPTATALAAFVAEHDPDTPAVTGPQRAAAPFAKAFAERAGVRATPGIAQRQLALGDLVVPEGPGELRRATDDERDLMIRWASGFHEDIGLTLYGDMSDIVDRHLEAQTLYVWEEGGEAVSMAAGALRGVRGARIGFVYTPPEGRGRGRASRLVANLSRHLLDEGHGFVTLMTEAANPTSNRIYEAVGFRFTEDYQEFRFER